MRPQKRLPFLRRLLLSRRRRHGASTLVSTSESVSSTPFRKAGTALDEDVDDANALFSLFFFFFGKKRRPQNALDTKKNALLSTTTTNTKTPARKGRRQRRAWWRHIEIDDDVFSLFSLSQKQSGGKNRSYGLGFWNFGHFLFRVYRVIFSRQKEAEEEDEDEF